ncbi:propionate catabolism operon regulatory protein PrpR [Pseudomonas japonica]|uniref:Transcriptional regulator, propionate catabolism operon regulatory protein n=1 Tax=Pseudomonas japonica TaxID=256466 RepID=A0A239GKT7_9PSED|nr:propionate catabolism operon regulatory protein PrpR [Pseudomonas japonica]SNS69093.1 transcriptional regulator, propionate catabolism operon regulatory protein [Pseudomonas japonica]
MPEERYLPRIVALITHLRPPEGPSRMARIVQQVIPDYQDRAHIEIVETTTLQLLDTGRALDDRQDVDVIICSGATADYLRRHIATSSLAIRMGEYDLIRALDLARAQATKVGIVSFQRGHPELDAMASLFTVEVRQATYSNAEEAHQRVHQLIDDGYRVIVGSSTAVEMAEAAGAKGVLALNADAIRRALDETLAIARSRTHALIQQQRLNAVLRNLTDGVIAVDANGIVQSLNPRMAQLLDIPADTARDRAIAELMPELDISATLRNGESEENRILRIGGRVLAANISAIIESGRPDGAVISCQETNVIQRADRRIRSQARPRQFTARYRFEQILGDTPAFRMLLELARHYAQTDATVLITGESGTGKELLGQSLHNASPRQAGPFVAINCAAFPETLLESELFGYEDGAFTGSRKGGKTGLIEAAHTGTLFLDEIGDMPVSLQTRLLRVLQEREVLRLGASEPTPVDLRVLAATHCDLRERIADGRFREDLYYRLNILRLAVPPLRERAADIPLLANAILQRLPESAAAAGRTLLERLMPTLQNHAWPGNIRELENLVERAVLSAPSLGDDPGELLLRPLFPELFDHSEEQTLDAAEDLRHVGKSSEVAHVRKVLAACAGDVNEAARRLGISRTTLWRRLRAGGATPQE